MVIDANMYWMPEKLFTSEPRLQEFLRYILTQYNVKTYTGEIGDADRQQIIMEKPAGYQNLNYVQDEYQAEQQLRNMEEAGVDHAMLKTPYVQE